MLSRLSGAGAARGCVVILVVECLLLFVDMVRRRRDEVGGKHKGRKSYDRWLAREKSAP